MTITRFTIILISFFLISFFQLNAQDYKFKQYTVENGLSQPFVYAINQDDKGYLWIGTGEGLCRFDGVNFENYTTKEKIADNFITTSLKDKKNRLWFGHNNGKITLLENGNFKNNILSTKIISTINDIVEDNNNNIWLVSQNNGLIMIGNNHQIHYFEKEFKEKLLFSICFISSKKFILGTDMGLFLYEVQKDNSLKFIQLLEQIPETKIQTITPSKTKNQFWIGTEDEGAFKLKVLTQKQEKFEALSVTEDLNLDLRNIQHILEDKESNIWIATFSQGIYKLIKSKATNQYLESVNFNTNNGLSNNFVKRIFEDKEGNFWIGTYGGGVNILVDDFFTFYVNDVPGISKNVLSICYNNKIKWMGVENGIIEINSYSEKKWTFYNSKQGLPFDYMSSVYIDYDGTLWAGTNKNGLYYKTTKSNKFVKYKISEDQLENSINFIDGYGDNLWVATKNGLISINSKTKEIKRYNTANGLPHNNINHITIDLQGRVWVATNSNDICSIENGSITKYRISAGNQIIEVASITIDKNGDKWIASYGNGVFQFNEKKIVNYSIEEGLKSNYCYSITSDENGTIWVGHRAGLSRISNNGIRIFDKNNGIKGDCNFNSVFKDNDGNIWFGTTDGVVKYDHKKDKKNLIPPSINITSVKIFDKEMNIKDGLNLDNGIYRFRVDFIGLSFKEPESVNYQYKLEGYDLDWSDMSTNSYAQYNRLESGEYTFKVKACNGDGICNETPLSFDITVKPPIWLQWWFILLLISVLIYAIYLTIKIRERQNKKLQEYLKQTLLERTKEVVAQKEEIEHKNKDITDSINYAKRIQSSILPSIDLLRCAFPDSYIFYKPRDIVSGDFYWYRMVNKTQFLIACADSTGHGVPGAFLSMVGSTLIKDICTRKDVNTASDLLKALDDDLKNTLNQERTGSEQSFDGMDIAICVIDIITKKLIYSSAMRPIFIYNENELKYLKADRFSIGGDDIKDKQFQDQEFQLNGGDIVYMFTDGYNDQFGGPKGKKLKLSGLHSLLSEICTLPMEQQSQIIKQNFYSWKGTMSQVDDILLMAIKIP